MFILCLRSLAQEKISTTNHNLFIADRISLYNQPLNSYLQSDVGLVSVRNNRNTDDFNRVADVDPNEISALRIL
jgi:hypothetical protein